MTRFDSPIKDALREAEYNRLCSMVYFVLNEVSSKKQKKEWRKLGNYHVVQLLLRSASLHSNSYPDTFWVNPWIAQHLRSCEPGGLYHIVEKWLENVSLDAHVSDDPAMEDSKVRHLEQLLSALNRNS
jgi:hypothetical protein